MNTQFSQWFTHCISASCGTSWIKPTENFSLPVQMIIAWFPCHITIKGPIPYSSIHESSSTSINMHQFWFTIGVYVADMQNGTQKWQTTFPETKMWDFYIVSHYACFSFSLGRFNLVELEKIKKLKKKQLRMWGTVADSKQVNNKMLKMYQRS